MKWLKRTILRWASTLDESKSPGLAIRSTRDISHSIDSAGFNLKVYKASGGTVIETNAYDRRNDRHQTGLYVITDDKDLGNEISKIITMENLKT